MSTTKGRLIRLILTIAHMCSAHGNLLFPADFADPLHSALAV